MKSLMSVLLALLAAPVFAGTVTCNLETRPEDVSIERVQGYAVVSLAPADRFGLTWTAEPGSPLLPVFSGHVLIPADAALEEIAVTELDRAELGTGLNLFPTQPMRPLSQYDDLPFTEPDPRVYSTDLPYPAQRLTSVPAGSKAGYRICGFLYCPFEYHPESGRLVLITRARVRVRYQDNIVESRILSPGQRELFDQDVGNLVVNPEDVSRMAPVAVERDAVETDVIVFTSSTLVPALQDLRAWLARKGYFADIVRIDTITAPGRDTQEKMRSLLRDKFDNNGLKYVILAGDVQHVPCRYAYSTYQSTNVPADLYFADLDGTWDTDADNRFGELGDDTVDLYSDIYVGRLPLDDAADAANFLRKDTTYEICPDTGYLDNIILPSEVLWSNIDFSGQIVNTNICRALTAASTWELDSGLSMTPAEVISGLNAGRQLFHYAGHGSNTAFGSSFRSSDLPSLTNVTKPCIVNTMACNAGWFDGTSDCLGEDFVNATNGGAVSTCLNARYGWGAPPTMGPSSNLSMEFYNNYLKGMTQGQAYGLAKDFHRNTAFTQLTYRWSLCDWTLQGDPTMCLWRKVPQTAQVTHPDTIPAMPQTVTVQIASGYAPIRNARVALTHNGELLGRAVTNSNGTAYLPVPAIEDTFTIKLTVTGQDIRLYETAIPVIAGSPAPLIHCNYARVDDVNGRLDPNDTADIYLVVENRGNSPADSVTGLLATSSPYLTILDPVSTYGTLAPGDTASGDAYQVHVHPSCPHGHRAEFTLTTTAAEASWQSNLELVIGLPHARGGLWAVHDTGDYVFAVCANGGIGTTQWRGEGLGFIYPKARQWSSSAMMHGSLILATDTTWVCDNYYGAPNWKVCPMDFAMQESLRIVSPPELGDKEYLCTFTDTNHPQPRSLTIDHRSYASADPDHADFVVLEYRIHNNDSVPLAGLWTGIACDFRTANWNSNDEYDYAGTDSLRNLAFIRSAQSGETLALGIRHIYPAGMNGYANCIQHSTYINDGFTKAEKMKFLDGTLRQTTGTTKTNWHALSSSGPYAIPAGDSQIVAYVIGGGRTVAQLQAHTDTALAWYAPPVGLAEPYGPLQPLNPRTPSLQVVPRLFADQALIRYSLPGPGPFQLTVHDITGRCVERLLLPVSGSRHQASCAWRPALAPGVYFLRLGDASVKAMKLE